MTESKIFVPRRHGQIISCLGKDGKELDERLRQKYKCVLCFEFLNIPYQLTCGDRVCKKCLSTRYADFCVHPMFCKRKGQWHTVRTDNELILSTLCEACFSG